MARISSSVVPANELPVLVHPTAPPGVADMDMTRFQLTASIGFTFDTSLSVARMIYDGFFDRYRKLKVIAAHGGGALPYLISRMDQCFDNIPACRERISVRPSEYLPGIYADAVVFSPDGSSLASGSSDRTVRLWNPSSSWSRVFQGHEDAVYRVAFSPDGKMMATAACRPPIGARRGCGAVPEADDPAVASSGDSGFEGIVWQVLFTGL